MHVDDGLKTHLAGRPGHTPPVVAVGCGGEGHIAQFLAGLFRGQFFKGQLAVGDAQQFAHGLVDGVRTTQHFEGA